ncbi:ClpP/crotonase [Cytidiella melzeri]|nr:ClpP/crotonase [Cytidiella melzeri]
MKPGVNVEISQAIATITFNRPKSLNAITPEDYNDFAEALRAIDQRDDVVATVWQATGRMFCAGTDVGGDFGSSKTTRQIFLNSVVRGNTDPSHALAAHSKVLVAALNGPVFGIAAAFLGQFDFIYAVPEAYLSCPFTFLGLVSEGGASVNFVKKMGSAKANEALLFGKKISAQDLLECGFINKIFPSQKATEFHATVRKHLLSELDSLVPSSVLGVKKLIKYGLNEQNSFDGAILRESIAQADRIASGIPAERFGMVSRKEIKHKL